MEYLSYTTYLIYLQLFHNYYRVNEYARITLINCREKREIIIYDYKFTFYIIGIFYIRTNNHWINIRRFASNEYLMLNEIYIRVN